MGVKGKCIAVIRRDLAPWSRSRARRAAVTRIALFNGVLLGSALLAAIGDGPRGRPVQGGADALPRQTAIGERPPEAARARGASAAPVFVIGQ